MADIPTHTYSSCANPGKTVEMPVYQKLVQTIHNTIHEKIELVRANRDEPAYIILNKRAYLALCYAVAKCPHFLRLSPISASVPGTVPLDIEEYLGIAVILDVNASDDVKVLRKPYYELA